MYDRWAGNKVRQPCPAGASRGDRSRAEYDVKGDPNLPACNCDSTKASTDSAKAEHSRLMSLPLELRLQIYLWVHLMSPIRHEAPSPGYPTPEVKRYVQRPVPPADDSGERVCNGAWSQDHDLWTDSSKTEKPMLLCPDRPLCGLPSSLLRTSRQICREARLIPFQTNEFVFVNWFTSGLWAASAAVAGIFVPWQRQAMRYVRIEVTERDLREEASLRAWTSLSETWTGLRGLRVKIGVLGTGTEVGAKGGLGDAAEAWVSKGGLAEMEALERLEVELEVPTWDNGRKLAWCVELGRCLRERGSRSRVVCTERTEEEQEGEQEEDGGEEEERGPIGG